MGKILILNAKETKELQQDGFVIVVRGGLQFEVDNTKCIKPLQYKGKVVNPLLFGKDRLVLTIEQATQLMKEGHTTHTKNGQTFDIFEDLTTGEPYAIPTDDTYNGVLLKGEY